MLALRSGERVRDAKSWNDRRRPEILAVYQTEVFGKSPAKPAKLNYEVKALEKGALGGKADRKIVTVYFGETPERRRWTCCSTSLPARKSPCRYSWG